LDERAKREYRDRRESLRDDLEEATCNNDAGRADALRSELDALATQLANAVGLGGRDRRAVSQAERARVNVQRRLRDVVARIRTVDGELGEHFERSLRTGVFCVYLPTWAHPSA
jgi:non-specific serine/threonine protein kinase